MAQKSRGGRGGNAHAYGNESTAIGGVGGDAVLGDGGNGGNAIAGADNSLAIGGQGGRGGIAPGGQGGEAHVIPEGMSLEEYLGGDDLTPLNLGPHDTAVSINGKIIMLAQGGQNEGRRGPGSAYVVGNRSIAVGGQGAESMQPDGRGGRGGRAYIPEELRKDLGLRRSPHIRWPYFEPVTEPGRGADGPDTPQYMARRIIIEHLKALHFAEAGLSVEEAWWDRTVVPLAWINMQLEAAGHLWRTKLIDDEYEFFDVSQ